MIDPKLIDTFRRRGCLQVQGAVPPEMVRDAAPALRDYVMKKRESISEEERACGASTQETMFSLGDAPPGVADFVKSARLGEIAAQFLGVDAVRVLHFCGFFKESGGPATPLHQDLTYVPIDTDRLLSIWIPLGDVSPEMGPLVFGEGSHLQGPIEGTPDPSKLRLVLNGPMRVGDISLHMGWTVHGALKNTSDRLREAFVICYYQDGARVQPREGVAFSEVMLRDYFGDLAPGDLAATPLNPVVYSRADA